MGISISALIPLVLVCCLVLGGVIAFAKIATTPEPYPSAYYMYSNNYETNMPPDRNASIVTAPERVYVPPGDVERGLGGGMDGMGGGMDGMGGQRQMVQT